MTQAIEGTAVGADKDRPFGRPGRRADLARELHEAFARHGIDLLPGRAREMLDERVRSVAENARVSEQTALNYLPDGWAEKIAADAAFQREHAKVAEQTATGEAVVAVTRLADLIAGLAVAVQNAVWRTMDNALPASVGEPLDGITALAVTLRTADPAVAIAVPKSDLIATARLLGDEADSVRSGHAIPDALSPDQLTTLADRLSSDSSWAREVGR